MESAMPILERGHRVAGATETAHGVQSVALELRLDDAFLTAADHVAVVDERRLLGAGMVFGVKAGVASNEIGVAIAVDVRRR